MIENIRPFGVITGASSGLGAAFAQVLAAQGYDLAIIARRVDRLEELSKVLTTEYGGEIQVIACDLSNADAQVQIIKALAGRPVDILVNNAGYSIAAHFAQTDWQVQIDSITTLVTAVCSLTHALLPEMLTRKSGRIITISSILALAQGGAGHTLYGAEKAFVHRFMLSLAAELKGTGVAVTSVLPGTTASEFQIANGTATENTAGSSFFTSRAEDVAIAALRGNSRGQLIVIPGWHNKLLAFFFKIMPDSLIRWSAARVTATMGGRNEQPF